MKNKKKENVWCDGWIAGWNAQADMKKRACRNENTNGFLCSACRFNYFSEFRDYKPNYCPNCGARVVE